MAPSVLNLNQDIIEKISIETLRSMGVYIVGGIVIVLVIAFFFYLYWKQTECSLQSDTYETSYKILPGKKVVLKCQDNKTFVSDSDQPSSLTIKNAKCSFFERELDIRSVVGKCKQMCSVAVDGYIVGDEAKIVAEHGQTVYFDCAHGNMFFGKVQDLTITVECPQLTNNMESKFTNNMGSLTKNKCKSKQDVKEELQIRLSGVDLKGFKDLLEMKDLKSYINDLEDFNIDFMNEITKIKDPQSQKLIEGYALNHTIHESIVDLFKSKLKGEILGKTPSDKYYTWVENWGKLMNDNDIDQHVFLEALSQVKGEQGGMADTWQKKIDIFKRQYC